MPYVLAMEKERTISTRLPASLWGAVSAFAERHRRSAVAELAILVQEALDARGGSLPVPTPVAPRPRPLPSASVEAHPSRVVVTHGSAKIGAKEAAARARREEMAQ